MEYQSNNNDFESNEDDINHEISLSKNASGIKVRTLGNFDEKENKVIKVLQKVNDKTVDILQDAKNELSSIGADEDNTYTTDDLIFEQVSQMLQKYQQKQKDCFSNVHENVYQQNFMSSTDMTMLIWSREYKNNPTIVAELQRYLGLVAEWHAFVKMALIRKNPFFSKKMY